ncbi:tail fiber domain-containing protein [Arcticibacterium luteifluviistationis]|uniref:Peptidase S74 domain-containing protein n=1 Tax=Arcticibacterium luteifluviistationis TaxID=1784714 RepID=A0A2Z4GH17_9BACT|nr:tail fiber domain-containing protein [Arcticibacterium luteifluviistationis]AWW00219.1 hypothetical protein DJ013_19400 [Arcticibacterium luteifluviistationis]
MKKLLALLSLVLVSTLVTAQSVLITPGAQSINRDSTNQDQLNVFGNGLLVGPKVEFTEDDPASNVHTMSCASEVLSNSLAGTLKDPNGDADYAGGLFYDCRFVIYTYNALFQAYQIDFESLDTEADGDTIYVLDYSTNEVLGAYSGNTLPTSLTVSQNLIRIKFKTDNDANAGAGFVLKWKAIILKDDGAMAIQNYTGDGLVYDVESHALLSGRHSLLDFENRGYSSTALGFLTAASGIYSTALGFYTESSGYSSTALGSSTEASGDYSTALGYYSVASGSSSTAMGRSTEASGDYSTALGYSTAASGTYSTALGYYSAASGSFSTALGYRTKASGNYSTAIGTRASTNDYIGSMVLSDFVSSSGDSLKADATDRLLARFENGYTFYTDNNLSSATKYGIMAHNRANSWSSVSDSTKKENFIASNGKKVLKSVSQMRIGTWNYKGDDTSKNRHWGVMAQDFHHHFGKDAYGTIGNDTTIATADFDGVSFAAIKALEARTKKLQNDLASEKRFSASLEVKIEKLEAHNLEQYARLENDFKELKEMLLKSVALKED